MILYWTLTLPWSHVITTISSFMYKNYIIKAAIKILSCSKALITSYHQDSQLQYSHMPFILVTLQVIQQVIAS